MSSSVEDQSPFELFQMRNRSRRCAQKSHESQEALHESHDFQQTTSGFTDSLFTLLSWQETI